jgi:hypothetical protein
MFEDAPAEEEWRVVDERDLVAAEQAEWLALIGGFTPEQMLAERLAESRAAATRIAAEQYRVIDDLRLEVERIAGASWTQRDSLAWRELRAEVAGVLQVHERTAERMLDLARGAGAPLPPNARGSRAGRVHRSARPDRGRGGGRSAGRVGRRV